MWLIVYGIISSVILALYAVGFSLTYGVSGLPNFAHGALYILGGYVVWNLMNAAGLSMVAAAPLTVVACALLGFGLYWGLLLRVRGIPLSELVVTFAAGVALLELLTWSGFYGIRYSLPVFWDESFEIFGVVIDAQRIMVVATGVALVILLHLFVRHTRTGLAFAASLRTNAPPSQLA